MLKVGEGITTICNADSVAENGTLAVLAMPALQLGARRVMQNEKRNQQCAIKKASHTFNLILTFTSH